MAKLPVKGKGKAKTKTKSKAKPKSNKAVQVDALFKTDAEWRIEEDARTLRQTVEIRKDPKRLKAAKEYVDKEMQALKEVSKIK